MANFFSKLLNNIFSSSEVADDSFYEELEDAMIMSDVGADAALRIIDAVRREAKRKGCNLTKDVRKILKDYLYELMRTDESYYEFERQKSIISVIGVNGVGKTTSIGKLAEHFKSMGKKVILAAADTFRAGAIEQLVEWGKRVGVDVIRQREGSDPAAVVFDALQSFKAKNADILIIDTAGRLHTQDHLMEELKKIKRVIAKLDPAAPHETMLIIDAGNGQNALRQAEQFHKAMQLDSITVTKLDGTAKGGILFAISEKLGIPIRYIGVGEQPEDLRPFNAQEFVQALLYAE